MDVDDFTLEEMFLSALKSEVETGKVYGLVAENTKNVYLKDRLMFLVAEELKHEATLKAMYRIYFPGKDILLPEKTPVPITNLVYDPSDPIPDILANAMDAERATQEFYMAMAELMDDKEGRVTLMYLAAMEGDHYSLLESELKFYEGMNERFDSE